jgi:hypothetical protein
VAIPVHPDPGAITDKRAHEQAVADRLAGMLKAWHPDLGEYSVALVGSYPDTRLKVSGLNVRTERPMQREFTLWDFWQDWGTVDGTATVIYAQLAD